MRPMFGALGRAVGATSLAFISRRAQREGRIHALGLTKQLAVVRGCRGLTKRDMKLNDALPRLAIDPERVTPDIDVAAEGTAPILVNPTVNSSVMDLVAMSYRLTTPAALLDTIIPHGDGVYVLPDAALGPGDEQSIKIDAQSLPEAAFSEWVISRRYTAGTSIVFNPPAMTIQHATTGGQLVVTWMPVRSFDELQLFIEQENSAGVSVEHTVDLSASYVAATGIVSATFDTDLPGYDPAWRIEYPLLWGMNTQATWTEGGDTISVQRTEVVTP
jgi:hypothetical protein